MARSIPIHQDIFFFERRHMGFTVRQLKLMGLAAAVAVGGVALLGYALRLPLDIAVWGAILGVPFIYTAFFPAYGMNREEYTSRQLMLNRRGNMIAWSGEHVDPMGCEVTRAYAKRRKKRGFECMKED